jgi:hypothetical protein
MAGTRVSRLGGDVVTLILPAEFGAWAGAYDVCLHSLDIESAVGAGPVVKFEGSIERIRKDVVDVGLGEGEIRL